MKMYVSPRGNDSWSGCLAQPNAEGTDGPFATPWGAQAHIRGLSSIPRKLLREPLGYYYAQLDGPIIVHIAPGVYRATKTWQFTATDTQPTTWLGEPGAIIDGGEVLTGWEATVLNGVAAWTLRDPRIASGVLPMRELFVDNQRATVARWPKQGKQLRIKDACLGAEGEGWGKIGTKQFIIASDDAWDFSNLTDVEALVFHYWIEERMPVTSYDPATGLVTSDRISCAPLVKSWNNGPAPFVWENVVDRCSEPGEWAVDRKHGQVWYIPRAGESLATTTVCTATFPQILTVEGAWSKDQLVRHQRFEGLTFRHTAAIWPGDPAFAAVATYGRKAGPTDARTLARAGAVQAAHDVPGSVYFEGCEQCAVTNCTIEHVGWYGLEIGVGCSNIRVVGNTIRGTGAGGIRIGGLPVHGDERGHTGLLRVTDNHLYDGGHYFTSGVGILMMHAHHCQIVHNHIHDYFYTGISAGWMWGYKDSISREHLIAWNHIHDLGKGVLSDMGGIYLLGPQPGTHVHHNRIHDITCAGYGGWAIYPDEGCSHVVIEHNVCSNTNSSVFHQHFGRENTVRNNIFAFGGEGCIAISKREPHLSFTFFRNIVLSRGEPIYVGGYGSDMRVPGTLQAESNLFWDVAGLVTIAGGKKGGTATVGEVALTWDEWQASGRDLFSQRKDPGFVDAVGGDFTLAANSPALAMGFVPIDLLGIGPRSMVDRE